MREDSFFISKSDIIDNKITLSGNENEHLSKVLRYRVGDKVKCFYDNSCFYHCQIVSQTKNASILEIISLENCLANPKIKLTLFQGLPKLDKLDYITQKLTELGASKIVPFVSTYCVKKDNLNKMERLNKIVVNACKQCGRTSLLNITSAVKFDEMLGMLKEYDIVIFANEVDGSKHFRDLDLKNKKNIAIIVGSEGGFTNDEVEKIKNCNAISLTLGKRILRTETCAVSLASLVMLLLD